jgi:hypothetical protein
MNVGDILKDEFEAFADASGSRYGFNRNESGLLSDTVSASESFGSDWGPVAYCLFWQWRVVFVRVLSCFLAVTGLEIFHPFSVSVEYIVLELLLWCAVFVFAFLFAQLAGPLPVYNTSTLTFFTCISTPQSST